MLADPCIVRHVFSGCCAFVLLLCALDQAYLFAVFVFNAVRSRVRFLARVYVSLIWWAAVELTVGAFRFVAVAYGGQCASAFQLPLLLFPPQLPIKILASLSLLFTAFPIASASSFFISFFLVLNYYIIYSAYIIYIYCLPLLSIL